MTLLTVVENKNKKLIALAQVMILVLGIIAISYAIGSEVKIVSADVRGDSVGYSASFLSTSFQTPPLTIPPDSTAALITKAEIAGKFNPIVGESATSSGFFSWANIEPIIETVGIAAAIYFGVKLIGNLIAPNSPEYVNAAAAAGAGGYVAGTIAAYFGSTGLLTFGIGTAVGLLIFAFTFKSSTQEVAIFQCSPWQPPKGGDDCEVCNTQGIPCTEYQCRSLGLSCELLNKGTSDQKCVETNRNDAVPPVIQPWIQALLSGYRYTPDNAISPPDNGVKLEYISSSDNCIPAFTPLRFGVTLNENSKCKIDVIRKSNFSSMSYDLSSGLYLQNHSIGFSLPGNNSLSQENITLENGGNFELYVRCEDKRGNSNVGTFVFKYCVDKGPDTTPPYIVSTSINNNSPVNYNQTEVPIKVYVNEPSECRWSFQDRDYDAMENIMSCATSISSVQEIDSQQVYGCSTNLTGIKPQSNNDYYFKCRDQPLATGEQLRNTNPAPYHYRLIGTRPLVLDSVGPNGTLKDNTNVINVTLTAETSAGYKNGEAICQYSRTGKEGSYVDFFKTGSYSHEQELHLPEGDYTYSIKCFDFAGNTDSSNVSFSVETDVSSPQVVRAYHQDNSLVIITDETATCVYNTQPEIGCGFDFENGNKMTTLNDNEHYTDWNTLTNFYIKCKDQFGNEPYPDRCSIIVRPFSL